MCSHSHTNTHTHQRGSRPPGAFWALPAPAFGSQHQRGPGGKNCAPHTGVNSRWLENKELQPREFPPRPSELLSFVHPGRHLFVFENILIHRNSWRGWGLGQLEGRPSVFIQAVSSPLQWQQHSRDMQWCAGTIHRTRTGHGWQPRPGRSVGLQLLQLGPVAEQGEAGPLTGSAQPQGRGGTGAQPL